MQQFIERLIIAPIGFLIFEVILVAPFYRLLAKAGFTGAARKFWCSLMSLAPLSMALAFLAGGERAVEAGFVGAVGGAAFLFGGYGCLVFLALWPWPIRRRTTGLD